MPTDHRTELAAIKRFDQLVRYLRDPMGWPIDGGDFEELTFEYTPEELGIDAKNAAKIQEIKRLRPLSASQPWGIFFVKFEPKSLPVVALRRILSSVALKKRASANAAERAAWAADDLLFISNYGAGEERQISFAHFSRADDGRDLPTLKVLGWDNLDTALHLDAVAKELTKHLAWPRDDADVEVWRESWRAAFNLRHREVVTTSKELSIRLAELARAIRDRIGTALAIETDKGPLTKLMKAFQEALLHDLDSKGFADMYAQTIAYGLLSARIADPHKKTADDFAAHMRTNPFLRELMETFLKVGGRRGKAGGPGIDFDELGVSEVVELLDSANMEAVIRDFGDRNRAEDPVMHFYELFLHEYNKKLKVQRGVFYTPQPVVSYIVRSVHELLQTEFGLADGLADITTWGEMLEKHPNLKLPLVSDEPGETRTIAPDEPFVQILDPATGTATFLVEVIDVIYQTLAAKWKQQGLTDAEQRSAWNDYVPKHLLRRLHAFELMMAPYAIAHMKIGLKLAETGYHFETAERARIYLTNALEPWLRNPRFPELDALAHEAEAVNKIKREKRFTVVVGNPPYAGVSANMSPASSALVEPYKFIDGKPLGERKHWLQDDYVKFIRIAQLAVETSGTGILGYITNHGYLDNPTFRGMRQNLKGTFSDIKVLDLHGSVKKRDATTLSKGDENVFDIEQGVAIGLFLRNLNPSGSKIYHSSLMGLRAEKYVWLSGHSLAVKTQLNPSSPYYFFVKREEAYRQEYEALMAITSIFQVWSTGVQTSRDHLVVAFDRKELKQRLERFMDPSRSDNEVRAEFFPGKVVANYKAGDTRQWTLSEARRALRADMEWDKSFQWCLYRPFDLRQMLYDRRMVDWPRPKVMRHMLAGDNVALLLPRQLAGESFHHAFCTRNLAEMCVISSKTTEQNNLFPLYLYEDVEGLAFSTKKAGGKHHGRVPNYSRAFLSMFSNKLGLEFSSGDEVPASVTPEEILHYIYAVFHSPGFRSRYAEFLKIDFPRLPLTGNLDLFRTLARLGGELVALHLMDSPKLAGSPICELIGAQDQEIEKISWSNDTVWIDKAQATGFNGVPDSTWRFYIGGYQVCEKWLKDRKGRRLSKHDIDRYQKIVAAIAGTISLMKQIDEIIDAFGGWPAAFAHGDRANEGAVVASERAGIDPNRPKSLIATYQPAQSQLLQAAEPDGGSYQSAASVRLDSTRLNSDELDREDLICRIRQLFGDNQERERGEAIDTIARELGYQRTGTRVYGELDNALRAAVRRGIISSDRGLVRLSAHTIDQYNREFLKDQFLASLQGRQWITREEAVRAFARWMGFRRTGPVIEDAARSLINGLLREGRLESAASEIRRSD